jgi:septum formation topological specificity factor MinE
MARVPLSPTPNREGIYVAKAPFVIDETTIFKCEAIRTFPELIRRGVDVFTEYYQPVGLAKEIYIEDANAGAAIIILKSIDGQILSVPNTYLDKIPGQTGLSYQRNVITCDLAAVPDYVNVAQIEQDIGDLISRYIGVKADIVTVSLQYNGEFTDEQHIQMENLRKLNIRKTVPLSLQLAEERERNAKLTTLNDLLMQALAKGGLTPPQGT